LLATEHGDQRVQRRFGVRPLTADLHFIPSPMASPIRPIRLLHGADWPAKCSCDWL
jgi:hypothetical protein